jgi:predicted DNA-binding WGR domain protein
VRRFEFVGGTSSKFWEVDRAGAEVTVTFGRIGTAGQTQAKDLVTEAAAIKHLDALVAEKVKKGYVELSAGSDSAGVVAVAPPGASVAPPAVPTAKRAPKAPAEAEAPAPAPQTEPPHEKKRPAAPAEDVLVIPAAWRRSIDPRRSSPNIAALNLDLARAKALFNETWSRSPQTTEMILKHPLSDPALVAEVRAFLGEEQKGWLGRKKPAAITPAGAAGVAAICARVVPWHEAAPMEAIADVWVAEQGLPFAAAAAARTADVVLATEAQYVSTNTQFFLSWASSKYANRSWNRAEALLPRIRHHLALADENEFQAAVAAVAPLRADSARQRAVISFMFPSEAAWVAEDVAALNAGDDLVRFLLASVSTKAQLERVAGSVSVWALARHPELVYGVVEGVGAEAAPTLVTWFEAPNVDADTQKRLASALAVLPTDAAFQLLLDRADHKYVRPALVEAAERFPARALRLLSAAAVRPGAAGRTAGEVLRTRVLTDRDFAVTLSSSLTAQQKAVIESILEKSVALPVADPSRLHPVLVTPPWIGKRSAAKPIVVDGLEAPAGTRIDWLPGERDKWKARRGYGGNFQNKTWAQLLVEYKSGQLKYQELAFFAVAPLDVIRPYLPDFRPQNLWYADAWMERIIAVHELEALPTVMYAATSRPTSQSGLLLPFESALIAELMADWYVRLKSLRPLTLSWFGRHPGAARLLIPAAVGKPGSERRNAETALRVISQLGHREKVLAAASEYGGEARKAVEMVLNTDPLAVVPPRIPALPAWADPAILPQILLVDRSAALPPEAAKHVCTMLAMCKPGDVYPGVDVVVDTCDRSSLSEFAWSLFQQWQLAGMPSKEAWVLDAQGYLGDDETVRRLSPLIRAWPGEGGHARAVTGLDVLASIGTDVALLHLNGIADKAKFKGLKTRAQEKIGEVAAKLGLSTEELADRLVPDLGLDDDGSMTLDYGPRKFVVGFDEQLKPYVAEVGARRKELPAPGSHDDPTLAPESFKRFAALKKDARTLASDQIRRFERAMVTQRRWSLSQVRALFIEHPLLWHVSRRLVWATFEESGRLATAFRVAEDRTLADADDKELKLPDGAAVGIPHPLHLGQGVGRWSDLFADYEILQPFAQLGRDVYELTQEEKGSLILARFAGAKVETVKVLGLERFGWERGEVMDGGVQGWIFRKAPQDRAVVLDLDPGIIAGMATEWKEQTLRDIWVNSEPVGDWSGGPDKKLKFGQLDEVTASEIIRDLRSLVAR